MLHRSFRTASILLTILLAALFSGCGDGGGGEGAAGDDQRGELRLRLNTSAVPQALSQTTGAPDTIIIDILDPSSRQAVHPRSQFAFSRSQSFQDFLVPNVIVGTHLVRLEIYDSRGALFFSGEELAVLTPAGPTSVVFVISGGDGGDPIDPEDPVTGATSPSPIFRCLDMADDEQGQPDVDVNDSGFFFVVAKVTDASDNDGSFDTYGFIHGERFETTFDGNLPTRLDDLNGNDGDFDISQYRTMEADEPTPPPTTFFNQGAVFPRISLNESGAAVIAWLDNLPHPHAGRVVDLTRTPIIRSVLLNENSNTTNNSSGFREPEFNSPQAVPNIRVSNNLQTPAVSMTNSISGTATIDYAFFDGTAQSLRYADGGFSQVNDATNNGAPPVGEIANNITASFSNLVDLKVANMEDDASSVVVVGRDTSFSNRVAAELLFPPSPAMGFAIINENQPSEADPADSVVSLEVDWFDDGTIVVVYEVFDDSVGGSGLYARCFNSTLTSALGPEVEIAAPVSGVDNTFPDVTAVDADGTYLVTWTGRATTIFVGDGITTSTVTTEVLLQRFSSVDNSRTPATPISVATEDPLVVPDRNSLSRVACTTNGDAVVAWQTGEAQPNTFAVRVLARIYPNGSTL